MLRLLVTLGLAWTLLAGCAATVRQPTTGTARLLVPATSSRTLVLNVTGADIATQSEDWEAFKGEWRGAMAAAATSGGVAFAAQEGSPQPTGEPGTLVVVDVSDYRYLSPGARYGFGAFTGNAYVQSRVRFLDLITGTAFGERAYNTSSTAWQGVFSAMTEKQVRAICDQIVADVTASTPKSASAGG